MDDTTEKTKKKVMSCKDTRKVSKDRETRKTPDSKKTKRKKKNRKLIHNTRKKGEEEKDVPRLKIIDYDIWSN